MANVVRWGQSAYETDTDLSLERAGAEALGLTWAGYPESDDPPPLDGCRALVVTSRVRVDEGVLDRFEGSLVLTTTSGFDHIDVVAARSCGVAVGRCPLARRDPVVEQAVASLIALMRRIPALDSASGAGRWARGDLPGLAPVGLQGAKVLVVGLGVIGRRMAEVLRAMDAEVWGVDPAGVPDGVREVSLEEGLAGADAVTVHCALSDTSDGLLGVEELARMQPDAVLVNTARGKVVDAVAAALAVHEGRLRGVALDVFPTEPWPDLQGLSGPGVWLTPHSAGYVRDLGRRVADEVIATLNAWHAGRSLPHPVESVWPS